MIRLNDEIRAMAKVEAAKLMGPARGVILAEIRELIEPGKQDEVRDILKEVEESYAELAVFQAEGDAAGVVQATLDIEDWTAAAGLVMLRSGLVRDKTRKARVISVARLAMKAGLAVATVAVPQLAPVSIAVSRLA